MDKLAELRAKRAEKVDAFAALAEKMNADDYVEDAADQKAYDALKVEIEGFASKIKRTEEANALKGSLAKPVAGQDKPFAQPKRIRSGILKAFKGEGAEEAAYRSGMFFLATCAKDGFQRENAKQWCDANGLAITKYQGENINTTGGFLVPTEFESAIIDLREEYGTFRQEARVRPMSSDSMTIPRRASGVTAYYVGENSSITESQKGWDQVTLSAKKLACLIRVSTELSEDAVIGVADDLAQEMAYAFAVAEDAAGWTGDGTSTYGGIQGVKPRFVAVLSSSGSGAVDGVSGHDTFAEMDATDIATLIARLPKYAERNAKFYMSMACWGLVFQRLASAAGGVTIGELTGGKIARQYLGYPVVIDQTLPTSTGDLSDLPMFYFGDLSLAASMGTRRGITVKTSEDRYLEYDQIGIQATERFDIVVHDIGSSSAAGPLVAMMGE